MSWSLRSYIAMTFIFWRESYPLSFMIKSGMTCI